MSVAVHSLWGSSDISNYNNSSAHSIRYIEQFQDEVKERRDSLLKNTDTLSARTQTLLGKNCVNRFDDFKLYKNGWDSGRGNKLSTRSVAVLESFLSGFESIRVEPSLFFTRNGNLQLGWESEDGGVVEIEFYPDKIEYYIESKSEENKIGLTDFELGSLVEKVKNI